MKYVELGAFAGAILAVLLLIVVGFWLLGVADLVLTRWEYIHDKLRRERQEDDLMSQNDKEGK